MADESDADDGGIFRFWDFVLRRRQARQPEFDLANVERLKEAIAEFERENQP
jgi:hypothetical protein